jgi:ribokinase
VSERSDLVVVGAINVDLVVSGAALPRPGETVVGGAFAQRHGGKGGNQAVAAARALDPASGRVGMVGAVGEDGFGAAAVAALRAEGVDTARIVTAGVPTGVALIAVDAAGENQIAVAPGANAALRPPEVRAALDAYAPRVVLASLEVPTDCVRAAAEWAHDRGAVFVLNPAPASPDVRELAALATYLTPNEREMQALGTLRDDVVVVQTRGGHGATIIAGGRRTNVPAPAVEVVDTTGAGDCFSGVFAASLVDGLDRDAAVRRAVDAASLSVTREGARGDHRTAPPPPATGGISVTDAQDGLSDTLAERIKEFNIDATGFDDGRSLSVAQRGPDGTLEGGLTGWSWGGCCYIEYLWVRDDLRGGGLGSRLLAAAEDEAQARGCFQMVVFSHTFQAPDFYRRHAYMEYARTENSPRGHADVHFVKGLRPA